MRLPIQGHKWEFEFQQRDDNLPLLSYAYLQSFKKDFVKILKLPIHRFDYFFSATNKGFIKKETKKQILDHFSKCSSSQKYLKYYYQGTAASTQRLGQFVRKNRRVLNDPPAENQELAGLFDDFIECFTNFVPWFYAPWYFIENNILSDKVKQLLMKHSGELAIHDQINSAMLALTYPTKKLVFQEEQEHFYKLVLLAQKLPNFSTNIKFQKLATKYLKRYDWINSFLLLPRNLLDYYQLEKRVKSAIKNKFTEEYAKQIRARKKELLVTRRLIKKLHKDKRLLGWIRWTRAYGWILSSSVEQVLKHTSKIQPLLKAIARKLHIKFEDIGYFTSNEIMVGLKTGKLNSTLIHQRRIGYMSFIQRNKIIIFSGKNAKAISDELEKNILAELESSNSVRGQATYPGLLKGKVRIATRAQDSKELKTGEILITSMTTPDYVPAMRLAGAIVTDEGGLLCHAAIVSRELGKPCIVGTKIATKIFKNGDTIEVDAHKGIVRRL